MKTRNWINMFGLLAMLWTGSCVEPYTPEVLEAPNNYLVVNGFINANGPTTIQLLRTQSLTEETPPPVESGALVMIEAESGESYRLSETWNKGYIGNYQLNPALRYRLFIRTQNGKEYASDFTEVKQTPPIDEVTWRPVGDEVQVYISTHDPENDTRYYRWEFEETWHFRPAFFTNLIYKEGRVEYRETTDKQVYNCWKTYNSTTIELGTSIRLSQDVISDYKLIAIPYDSEKVGIKYSILVKQYALTREAYEYWETLKKNTENIGTLFDPLPSQLNGNIRCLTDPQEPVIGYMTATSMVQKRLFINSQEFPREWRTYVPGCPSDTLMLKDGSVEDFFGSGSVMPITEIYAENTMNVIGYTFASQPCVDCTTRGTNIKPDFWE